jgi:hypothetical protein
MVSAPARKERVSVSESQNVKNGHTPKDNEKALRKFFLIPPREMRVNQKYCIEEVVSIRVCDSAGMSGSDIFEIIGSFYLPEVVRQNPDKMIVINVHSVRGHRWAFEFSALEPLL